jgi:hypothetical protein
MTWRLSMASQQPFNRDLESRRSGERQHAGALSGSDLSTGALPSLGLDDGYAIPLVMGLGRWQLHRAQQCRLGRRPESLEKKSSAMFWLRAYRQDTFAMAAMRQVLLSEGWSQTLIRLRDADVIEHVARLLERGLWHVCEPVMQLSPMSISQAPAPAGYAQHVRRAPSQSSAPPPSVSEIPEPATLAGNVDQAALAQTLVLAGRSGVPFCQECAKLAQARAQPGAQI